MRAAVVAIALLAAAPVAAADTIVGEDTMSVTGTVAIFGKDHSLAQHRDMQWTARGDVVTFGKIVDVKLQDGEPSGDTSLAARKTELARSRRFEARWLALVTATTFTPDVPVAFTADQIKGLVDDFGELAARRFVVTLAGTQGDIAHYRVFAVFSITSLTLGGDVTLAGSFDVDVRRHAMTDLRVNGLVGTTGVARFDAKASAHLTRRYR